MGIKEEIAKIAVEQGYDGAKPKSIAQAIDALTDTLAGENVKDGRTIAGAIHALAPYIGSGGGGGSQRVELFNETVTTVHESEFNDNEAQLAYRGEITDDPLHVVFDGVEYDLPKVNTDSMTGYGAAEGDTPDFSTYPLFIMGGSSWMLITKDAGTHTIVAYGSAPIVMYKISAGGDEKELRVDSRGKLESMDSISDYGDVYTCGNYGSINGFLGKVQGGLWVAVSFMPPSAVDANQLSVFYDNMGQHGDELPNVSKFVGEDSYVTLTFQVPSEISGGYDSLAIDTNGGGGGGQPEVN